MKTPRVLPAVVFLWTACVVPCGGAPAEEEAELEKMTRKISRTFKEVPQLSTAELAAWLADASREAPQLLDAREMEEFAVSHLPGAIRIDPDADADAVLARIEPGRPVVIYCSVGYRSSVLARRLRKAGHTEAVNLEGSIFKWANEGRPLAREEGTAAGVHPYNEKYGRMLKKALRSYR